MKYVSLRAENSWRMRRMLILNSAWPFSPVRSELRARARQYIRTYVCTYLNQRPHTRKFRFLRMCRWPWVGIGANQHGFQRRNRVRQFGTRTYVSAAATTGWLPLRSPKGGTQVTLATRGETIPSSWRHITRERPSLAEPENSLSHLLSLPPRPYAKELAAAFVRRSQEDG